MKTPNPLRRTLRRFSPALQAYGLYTGGVIGVGIFGLPAALVRAGLVPFLANLFAVALLAWGIHRCYLTVVCATPGRHRLPGYTRLHLGAPWDSVAATVNVLGLGGALVAYLIAGGTFLRLLFPSLLALPQAVATLLYLSPGALLLLRGLRAVPALELLILGLFLVLLVLLPPLSRDHLDFSALALGGPPASLLLPYGVLLFSFWGLSLVPEAADLVRRREAPARRILASGLLTAVLTSLLFAFLVASITGPTTTEDALVGLRARLTNGVVLLALVFGVLTTFSSYLALGVTLLRTLRVDFRVPSLLAWAFTVGPPALLVLFGIESLLAVLSFTGAVFLGLEGLLVLALRWSLGRARPAALLPLVVAAGLLVIGVISALTTVGVS